MKKMMAMLLSLTVLALMTVGVFATGEDDGGFPFNAELDGDQLTVYGDVPAGACEGRDDFTYLFISTTTTEIGARAFANCSNLQTIYFSWADVAIDPTAFDGVTAQVFGEVPDLQAFPGLTVSAQNEETEKAPEAVSETEYFATAQLFASFADAAVKAATEGDTLHISGEGTYAIYPTEVHPEITKLVIGAGITRICPLVFYCYPNITDITFEGSCPQIDDDAFRGITAKVHVPQSWAAEQMQNCGGALTYEMLPATASVFGEGNVWLIAIGAAAFAAALTVAIMKKKSKKA